jgi:hypothetical protein
VSDFDLDDGGNAREWFYGGLLQGNLFGGWCAINTATAGGMAFDPASNILYYSTSLRAQGLDWIERGRSGGWDEGGEQTAQKKDADGQ